MTETAALVAKASELTRRLTRLRKARDLAVGAVAYERAHNAVVDAKGELAVVRRDLRSRRASLASPAGGVADPAGGYGDGMTIQNAESQPTVPVEPVETVDVPVETPAKDESTVEVDAAAVPETTEPLQ